MALEGTVEKEDITYKSISRTCQTVLEHIQYKLWSDTATSGLHPLTPIGSYPSMSQTPVWVYKQNRLCAWTYLCTQRMGMKLVSETLVYLNHLMQLSA
jgi:hypothetical protein